MRDFVIFFEEKEGTSPLVRMLDRFDGVSVARQRGDVGWEPFDRHNCGHMSIGRMRRCLDLLFGGNPDSFDELDALYRVVGASGPGAV